jgi:hypothetical protein
MGMCLLGCGRLGLTPSVSLSALSLFFIGSAFTKRQAYRDGPLKEPIFVIASL